MSKECRLEFDPITREWLFTDNVLGLFVSSQSQEDRLTKLIV